jgi:hypothetical protein
MPGEMPRRSASAGCRSPSGSRACRRSDVSFTNVVLRKVCAGDEISVSGYRFTSAASRSADSYGGV